MTAIVAATRARHRHRQPAKFPGNSVRRPARWPTALACAATGTAMVRRPRRDRRWATLPTDVVPSHRSACDGQ